MHYSRDTRGAALRDQQQLALVTVTENVDQSATPVPIAGANRIDYEPKTVGLPSTIVFDVVYDKGFERELLGLAEVADDVDRQRRQRGASVGFTLSLYDGRELRAWIRWPRLGHAALSRIIFPLSTKDL